MKNKLLSILFAVAAAILIITFSIGLPIYFRPFYYIQIETLDITENAGEDYATIKAAYDELLDYLTIPGNEFGTGVFEYSESGKSHFEDCKVLFDLNIIALLVSLAVVITLLILKNKGVFTLCRPFGFNILFTVGSSILLLFGTVAGLAALDFDKAFEVFHTIFFPGKDNWVFSRYEDRIITALPQDFFMNCAILIVSSIIIISLSMIVIGIATRKKKKSQ